MWLVALVWFATFGFIGGALAHARGYNAAFGALVGLTGFGAPLMLAYLPDRSRLSALERSRPSSVSLRVEAWLHGAWLFVVGVFLLVFTVAGLSTYWPSIGPAVVETPVGRVVGPMIGVATAFAAAIVYVLAFYTLVRDERLPRSARAPWVVALVFLTLLAGLLFVPWRWVMTRGGRPRNGAVPALDA